MVRQEKSGGDEVICSKSETEISLCISQPIHKSKSETKALA